MTMPLNALGATVDYTTESDPELRIKWSAIKDALTWTTAPTSTGTQDLDPWIASIVHKIHEWDATQTTELHDVTIPQAPFQGVGSRNNIPGRVTYSYTVTVFTKTPVPSKPDADDLQN